MQDLIEDFKMNLKNEILVLNTKYEVSVKNRNFQDQIKYKCLFT